jgi:predicted acylesterase/phospholipase RssA
MEKKDTLYLGLCLAGAVSAGAYTAGVIDYLLEALEDWESRRGQPGVPSHRVVIPTIGGASAGGMTGTIMASAINNPVTPVRELSGDIFEEQPMNKLYHTWVDLTTTDMFPVLLDNGDINGQVYSLFNSQFIDELSDRAIKVDKSEFVDRPYFDRHLKLFTTLTNLKGFPYNVNFAGGYAKSVFYLSRHNDYAAFVLNKTDDEYNNDGWIPLDFFRDSNVDLARSAAMATGAFPVGLRSRSVVRKVQHLNDFRWHQDITRDFPLTVDPDNTLCVDGGMINNEPFFRVKDLLSDLLKERAGNGDDFTLKEDPDTFECSILMVDPFPSKPADEFKARDGLAGVIGSTLGAMLNQMRLKPEALRQIYDQDNHSLFMIGPSRMVDGISVEGEHAIACGFFGGFGGFINKEFRIHDFFLGRGNCERFLRERFTVPVNNKNPIFKNGYAKTETDQFRSRDGRRQIIPVFKPEADKKYMPRFRHNESWPVRTSKEIDTFRRAIRARTGSIIMNLANYSRRDKFLISIGNKIILEKAIASRFLDTIKESMAEWKLLQVK